MVKDTFDIRIWSKIPAYSFYFDTSSRLLDDRMMIVLIIMIHFPGEIFIYAL